jgi:hypothetical protein
VSGANHDVTVDFLLSGVTAAATVNNPLLHPTNTRNSTLCVAFFDGENFFIL